MVGLRSLASTEVSALNAPGPLVCRRLYLNAMLRGVARDPGLLDELGRICGDEHVVGEPTSRGRPTSRTG